MYIRRLEIDAVPPQYASLLTGHYQEGSRYATHRTRGTRDYLLVLTLAGHGRFAGSVREEMTGPGDLVLLAPGTPHHYTTAGPHWELLWVHFLPRPHWHDRLHWPACSPGLMRLSTTNSLFKRNIEQTLRETHRLATGAGPSRDAFALNALEQALLWCDAACPRTVPMDPRVQAAMEYLQGHLEMPGTLEDAAQEANLSPSRLTHLFKEQTGVTPGQFVEAQRMERARQMLSRTSLSVGAIAADIGYDNPFYFTQRFKKAMGQSPTEFRRSCQDKE